MSTENEELEKIKKERDGLKKKIKELEDQNKSEEDKQQDVDLELQRLQIMQKQAAALGEVYTAQQLQLKIRDKLQEKLDIAAQSTDRLAELEKQKNEGALSLEKERELVTLRRLAAEQEKIQKLINLIDEQTKGIKKQSKAQDEAQDKMQDFFEGIGTRIGILSPSMNRYLKITTEIGNLARDNPQEAAKALRQAFSPTKIILGLTMQIFEATMKHALAVDKATAAFAAQTGAGRALTQEIASVGSEFRNLGLGAEDAGKAAQSLFNNFTGFMQASREGKEDLMQAVASLEKIGVSGETSSKTLNVLSNNFGMSTKQATKMAKELSIAGTKIGISAEKMMSGYQNALKSLAVYGKESAKIFKDIAAQAKAAGVETQTLLGLADKFDTFSSAADTAGKLNSILGTQMSATELLTMKENERIEALISSVQAQGRSFKDMDRFSQKAIANAAGITDMAEAQRIFSMSLGDYRKGLKDAATEEEYNKRLKDSMDIYKKLEKAFENFAMQLGPFIDKLAGGIQMFLDFSQYFQGWPVYIIGAGLALKGFAIILSPLLPLLGLFSTAAPAAGAGGAAAAPGLMAFAEGLAVAAPAFLKGSLGLLAVGAAFFVFASGFALLAKAFKGDLSFGAAFGFMSGVGLGLVVLAGGLAAVGAIASAGGGLGFAAIMAGAATMAIALAMIGKAAENLNVDALSSLATIMGGFGDFMINFKVGSLEEAENFLNSLTTMSDDVKPVLADLALLATGKTAQSLTANTASYNFNTFAANFKNIFKPEITVKIGDKELKSMISDEVANSAKDN